MTLDLTQAMTEHGVPGASVAVLRDGEVVEQWGFGVRADGEPGPVAPDTLFQACSISKLVTVLGVLGIVNAFNLMDNLDGAAATVAGASAAGIALLAAYEAEPDLAQQLEERLPGPDDPAFLMFTSGTTGQPKAALHSHNTAWSAGRPVPDAVGLTGDDVCFMASTVGHLTGFFWGMYLPLAMGQKVVYQDEWDARRLVDIVHLEGITWSLSATPFAMDMIAAQKLQPRDLSTLRVFVCGGAPIPPHAALAMQEHLGVDLVSLYGMTEVGICTIHRLGAPLEVLAASDGMPVAHMEVRLVDDDLNPVSEGEEGRIQALGPSIILGYLGQPEMTEAAETEDGWFETGDLGRWTPDGGLRITGRGKDIIVRGGQNVPVVEIENLLALHDKIADVAVVGYPDDRLGERGCAFVVATGSPPTLAELTSQLDAAGMARQFWPERLEIVDAMPRTPSGKIKKFVLRESLIAGS